MAFTQAKGKPIKEHAFPIRYDDAELRRIQTVLVDFVDPLISLPKTTRVRGEALHAYMMNLLIAHALNGIRRFMFLKHNAHKSKTKYRSQQLFLSGTPAPAVKYRQQPS